MLLQEVIGWKLEAAADFLKKAGFDFRVTETLAPRRRPDGERRIARIRLDADGVTELVVVYTGSLADAESLDQR